MKVEKSNPFGALSEARLVQFEVKIGHMLPRDYRQFLLDHNGGKPTPSDFTINDEQGGDTLHHVYGLYNGPGYARLEDAYATYAGRIPAVLLPIADDPGGNVICLGLTGPYRGNVYFWDHESESDDEPGFENVVLIANSFQAFLDSLYEYVDPDETETERIIRMNDIEAVEAMVQSGYDIEAEDAYGRTLLENAAIANNIPIFKLLLARGAELGESLWYARQNNHEELVKLIEENKSRSSRWSVTPDCS